MIWFLSVEATPRQWPAPASGVDFRLAPGSRCLVLGANGAGKSTLLQLLAGQKMAPPQTVAVANEARRDVACGANRAGEFGGGGCVPCVEP